MKKILVTTTPEGNFEAVVEEYPETRTNGVSDREAIYLLIIRHQALFDVKIELTDEALALAFSYSLR